jgi:hypothetical protein
LRAKRIIEKLAAGIVLPSTVWTSFLVQDPAPFCAAAGAVRCRASALRVKRAEFREVAALESVRYRT